MSRVSGFTICKLQMLALIVSVPAVRLHKACVALHHIFILSPQQERILIIHPSIHPSIWHYLHRQAAYYLLTTLVCGGHSLFRTDTDADITIK